MKPTLEEKIRKNIRTQAPTLDLRYYELSGDEKAFQLLTNCTHLEVLFLKELQQIPKDLPSSLLNLDLSAGLLLQEGGIIDLYPLQSLTQLQSLRLSNNQITNLFPLQSLAHLQYLWLDGNQITDLSPLQFFTQLQELDLDDNQITDLSPLQSLAQLQQLWLGSNRITDLSPLQSLAQLQELWLGRNHIKDIPDFKKLVALKELHLDFNKIQQFPSDWPDCLPKLEQLDLRENPITNLPPEIYNTYENCLPAVKDYCQALRQGATKVHQTKVILIGNGRVGKTCLVKRWLDKTFNQEESSTHAIQLRSQFLPELAHQQGLDQVQLNVWDFGGQDIYHSTHQLFMQTEAVFVLVWDADTENQPTQSETLKDGTTVTYHNHRLAYWLNYVRYLGNSSPVIVVQSKRDLHGQQVPNHWNNLLQTYPNIVAGLSVGLALDDEDDNGIGDFKHKLYKVLRKQIKQQEYKLPTSWWKVRLEMGRLQSKQQKTLTLAAFSQICKAAGVATDGQVTLRDYLHHAGALFYQKGLFEDRLIVDQKWAIEAVYTLFDRHGLFMKYRGQGFFKGEDLALTWKDKSSEEQALLVSFMESCKLCVEIGKRWKSRNGPERTPFVQRIYLAPLLLPEAPIANESDVFSAKDQLMYLKFVHPFLHAAVMQAFIVANVHRVSDEQDNIRRNSIYFKHQGQKVLVRAFPAERTILVKLEPSDGQSQLDGALLFTLEEQLAPRLGQEVEKWVSIDGEGYVGWETLQNPSPNNTEVQADNGKWYKVADFDRFLPIRRNLQYKHLADHLENSLFPQQALAYLEQANIARYFEALGQVTMTFEQKNRFHHFKQAYQSGRYGHEFEGRLRVFAQGFLGG